MADKPFRVLPKVTDRNRHFWQGGADGELRFLRCRPCGTWIHPPQPVCPDCLGKELSPEAVSGRATVLTYTLNHQPWVPSPDHPYCIAIVEIEEQEGLRLMTNIVNCPAEEVEIGMPVRVVFEHHDDVWMPLFEPRGEGAASEARSEAQPSEVGEASEARSEAQPSEVGEASEARSEAQPSEVEQA